MKKYNVPALEKAVAILNLMAGSASRFTLTELHSKLDISKATVFTILNVLEDYKVVKKDEKGKYGVGVKLYEWGMKYVEENNLIDIARPHLYQLMKKTGYTVHLGRLDEGRILYLDKHEPDSFIRFFTFPGMRMDIHISALGKVIASYLSEEQLNEIFDEIGFKRYTAKTITDLKEFRHSIQSVLTSGFVVEDEEGEIGVRCIGSPILDLKKGQIIAAISIAAHTSQLSPDVYEKIGQLVHQTAVNISQELV